MKGTKKEPFAYAMAFYHEDGLPAAWRQAIKFAGIRGRIGTMLDVVAARIGTKPGEEPWETYYTTLSAEYYGLSRQGNRILIIAHGIGPMSTLDGCQKAYSWQYKDKERNRRGGRITAQEFLDLESGKYGDVHIVDFEAYCGRYEYPFIETLRYSEALTDPVLQARFGPQTEQYLLAHVNHARRWHREQAGVDPENKYKFPEVEHQQFLDRRRKQHLIHGADNSDPLLINVQDESNLCYTFGPQHGHRKIEDGYAFAHLLSTGRLVHLQHQDGESLTLDVGLHGWTDGTRLIGIQEKGSFISGIQSGPDAYDLLRKNWRVLLKPINSVDVSPIGFCALVKVGKQWFTQYPKVGDGMDNYEPEYVVTSMEKVGKPVLFRTTVGGFHGFFKFATKEVHVIAPLGANAYSFVSEPVNEWHDNNPTHQTAMVQFYRIEADTTRRLIRKEQLAHDYEIMMSLM